MGFDRRGFLCGLFAAPLARAAGSESPGFDAAALADAARRAESFGQLRSLIVARGGAVAFARAFRGPPLDRPVNVKSVSKTLVAALTGVAIERGALTGVDQPITDVLDPPRGADPRVEAVTVAHLLTMQAGLERTSGRNYGAWVESRNWVADALSRPFVAEPGERFLYSTGSYHLLGAVLARATGRSLLALARDWLGDPLGVAFPPWTRDPQGLYMGGNNMAVAPEGLLRFGEAARSGGVFEGARVLPESWIAESWTPRTRSPFSGDAYGYGWFLTTLGSVPAAYARGYGGQMLFVLPELAMTVVVTSDPTRPARSRGYAGDLKSLVADSLVPAARAA